MHFRVNGKRDKDPLHPGASDRAAGIAEYLKALKHGGGVDELDMDGPLFRPVRNNRTGHVRKSARSGLHLPQHRRKIWPRNRHSCRSERDLRTLDAHDRGDECPLARGGFHESAGMDGPRECLHNPPLRPAQKQAGGQSDLSREVLMRSWRTVLRRALSIA